MSSPPDSVEPSVLEQLPAAALPTAADEPTGAVAQVAQAEARVARRAGLLLLACGVIMIPWSVYMFASLPRRVLSTHYSLAWGGFDVFLTLSLLWTAYNAIRPTRWLSAAASSTATMVFVDAWFDVVTTPAGTDRIESIIMALLVELPMAGACLWLGIHAQELRDRTLILALRRRQAERREGRRRRFSRRQA